MHNPAHAGELIAEWLYGLKDEGTPVTVSQLAERIQITRAMLSRIINGKAPLTADIALRLNAALGINVDLLMGAQTSYDNWKQEFSLVTKVPNTETLSAMAEADEIAAVYKARHHNKTS